MANSAGAPVVASLRTIKSDVVVGLGPDGDALAEKLDEAEPGWKISGKYVSVPSRPFPKARIRIEMVTGCRPRFRRTSWGKSALCMSESLSSGCVLGLVYLYYMWISLSSDYILFFLKNSK